ncbi:MAG: DNA-binding response regulator [Chitinophagia bacterium]|nr:DNA-binding response regulator [Chitinophagia bacterium]
MITLALVDDHILFRKSMAALLELMGSFKVVFQGSNGMELIAYLEKQAGPDLILLDVSMPIMNGPETCRWINKNCRETKVIALSMLRSETVIISMLTNGACAYLLKDAEPDELKNILIEVHEKGFAHNEMVPRPALRKQSAFPILLSDQEKLFIQWACTDKTHKEIADILNLSPRTIDGYRDSVFKKLQVNSRVGIVLHALRNGIVPL